MGKRKGASSYRDLRTVCKKSRLVNRRRRWEGVPERSAERRFGVMQRLHASRGQAVVFQNMGAHQPPPCDHALRAPDSSTHVALYMQEMFVHLMPEMRGHTFCLQWRAPAGSSRPLGRRRDQIQMIGIVSSRSPLCASSRTAKSEDGRGGECPETALGSYVLAASASDPQCPTGGTGRRARPPDEAAQSLGGSGRVGFSFTFLKV